MSDRADHRRADARRYPGGEEDRVPGRITKVHRAEIVNDNRTRKQTLSILSSLLRQPRPAKSEDEMRPARVTAHTSESSRFGDQPDSEVHVVISASSFSKRPT